MKYKTKLLFAIILIFLFLVACGGAEISQREFHRLELPVGVVLSFETIRQQSRVVDLRTECKNGIWKSCDDESAAFELLKYLIKQDVEGQR